MMEPEGDAGIHPFQKKCTMHSHQRKFLVYVDVCFLILALFLQAFFVYYIDNDDMIRTEKRGNPDES